MRYLEESNSLRQKIELWLSGATENKNEELLFNECRVSVWKKKVLEIGGDYNCTKM